MNATILNAGENAWIFEEFAARLSQVLDVPVSDTPADFNYVLGWNATEPPAGKSFVPFKSIAAASDKRYMARLFVQHNVSIPRTLLLDSSEDVFEVLQHEPQPQWVLKWPTGCGASGHRVQTLDKEIPLDWPRPYVLQEFIQLEKPEVYRLYCIANETFGWNVRRFPADVKSSPFVAHAQGARYELVGEAPHDAELQARRALESMGLLSSFGCADLMRDSKGIWRVLEVNTDGVFNHVDRDIDVGNIAAEIDALLKAAFSS